MQATGAKERALSSSRRPESERHRPSKFSTRQAVKGLRRAAVCEVLRDQRQQVDCVRASKRLASNQRGGWGWPAGGSDEGAISLIRPVWLAPHNFKEEEMIARLKNVTRPLKAIRQMCLDCAGGSHLYIKYCTCHGGHGTSSCPLWSYRFGLRPGTVRRRYWEVLTTPELMQPPDVPLEECQRWIKSRKKIHKKQREVSEDLSEVF